MIWPDIQGIEVVIFGLDFGAFHHAVAQLRKNAHDVVHGLRERMTFSKRNRGRGQRHVDVFGCESRIARLSFEYSFAIVEKRFDGVARVVDELPDTRAFFG